MKLKVIFRERVAWINLDEDKIQWRIILSNNEQSDLVQNGTFIEELSYSQFLKYDSARWS
jgi:hypothetical protein